MKYDPKGYHGPSTLKRHEPDSPEAKMLREAAAERLNRLRRAAIDSNVSMWGAPWPAKEEKVK